ncbi:penicillin-binding protein 1A [uncultured Selenomonas sp.]|uniref:transglycosylase domain-containing protein n=1 Tax=uncultured Selenomonas sp. TaxID=159275 RepID=UPI0025CF0C72|nr:penicillin-binding protein 1A [uncultured Selenomonas sp.]
MEKRPTSSRRPRTPQKATSNGKGIGCGFLTASMNTKPDLAHDILPPASSHIYDTNGNEIANIHADENREPVKIAQVPKDLQNAFVAVEDNRFYDHMGVDPRGIARAIYANLRGRTVTEGGSTITQQLAKNAYLTQDRTLKRKIQEVFLALQLERQYTKQEILELYLNQIYFGQGAYGVQAAAQTYFGKNVEDLDLDECAMLAGIPKSPNYYSPQNNLQAAQERKATVLDQMAKYGYITETEAAKTKKMEPTIIKPKPKDTTNQAAYFVEYVTQLMIDKYGADAVYKEGLKIYTTIDMDMQKAAEDAMKNLPNSRVDANGVQQPQGALVAIDPHNGYIKAMVGGRGTDQFNRATMAERQPGSAFKPFVFAAALENKFTPSTVIDDSPMKVGDWAPQNYNRTFNGKVTLRYVAEQSLNVPTVKIAQKLGIDKPIYYAQEMGISSFVLDGPQNDRNLSTALGGLTKGVTPLELVSAYGTFANKGVHVDPVAVTKVLDRNGKVLEQAEPKQRSVISEQSAAELTDMLEGVIQKGTGTRAKIGRPAAGKTGTTSDYHDAWFVGYTPDLVAGVWIGSDDNASLGGMSGGLTPAVIWKAFMSKALASTPPKNFDGSSAGGKSDAIGELENDKKSELKSDKKAANGKQDSAKSDGGKNAQQGGQQSQGGGNQQSTPAQAPAQQPAAPASNVPEPGGGVSKGRN